MREIIEKKPISIPEVKEILDAIEAREASAEKEEQPIEDEFEYVDGLELEEVKNYYLKSTHEYVSTFSKMEANVARAVVKGLVEQHEIPITKAIQIVNVNPDTVEELMLFFEKGSKRLNKDQATELLYAIRELKEID